MSDWKGLRWEYHVHAVDMTGTAFLTDGALDNFGTWGWELVMMVPITSAAGQHVVYTFKRPVQQAKIELP